jgi:hypothetical protein
MTHHQALVVAHKALQSELQARKNWNDGGSEFAYVVVLIKAHSLKVDLPFEFQVLGLTLQYISWIILRMEIPAVDPRLQSC